MPSELTTTLAKYIDLNEIGEFPALIEIIGRKYKPDLVNMCAELFELLPPPKKGILGYNFVANSDLSGLGTSCMEFSCRLEKLNAISSFAALYAEQVVLFNPFDHVLQQIDYDDDDLQYFEVYEIAFAVNTILFLNPLIAREIVTFIDFEPERICNECFDKLIGETLKIGDEEEFLFKKLYDGFVENTTVKLVSKSSDTIEFEVNGSKDFIEHEQIFVSCYDTTHDTLGVEVGDILPEELVHKLGIFRRNAEISSADVLAKNFVADKYSVKSVFSNGPELQVLSSLFPDSFLGPKFNAEIPFISAKNISDALSLRDTEWHHFERYRKKFFGYIESIETDDRLMEELYRDDILAELGSIERTLEKSKSAAGKTLIDNVGISAFSISTALMSGGISSLLGGGISVLGGGHFAKTMVPALRKRLTVPDKVKDNDLYFAWNIKRKI